MKKVKIVILSLSLITVMSGALDNIRAPFYLSGFIAIILFLCLQKITIADSNYE